MDHDGGLLLRLQLLALLDLEGTSQQSGRDQENLSFLTLLLKSSYNSATGVMVVFSYLNPSFVYCERLIVVFYSLFISTLFVQITGLMRSITFCLDNWLG